MTLSNLAIAPAVAAQTGAIARAGRRLVDVLTAFGLCPLGGESGRRADFCADKAHLEMAERSHIDRLSLYEISRIL